MQVSGKASVAFGKALRKIIFTFCNTQKTIEMIVKQSSQNVTRSYFGNSKVKQFSKRFDWNNIFTAILTNRGIGKSIGDTGKGIKKNYIYDK